MVHAITRSHHTYCVTDDEDWVAERVVPRAQEPLRRRYWPELAPRIWLCNDEREAEAADVLKNIELLVDDPLWSGGGEGLVVVA